MPVGSNLMAALAAALVDFDAKVAGDPGQRIAAVGRERGVVIDLCRAVLGALGDAFAWLAHALDDAADVLRVAEAFLALVEVAGIAFDTLTESLAFGDLPDRLGLPRGPFAAVDAAMATARTAVARSTDIVDKLPGSADLHDTRAALGKLLGRRVDVQLQDDGSLGRLLRLITPVPA